MKSNALILLLIAGLAACSDKTQVPQHQVPAAPAVQAAAAQPAAAPVIINQAPAAAPSSGVGDMLMGGALGYMLGSAGNRGGANIGNDSRHTTVNRTTVVKKTVIVQAAPKPVKPYSAPKSTPARTSYKSSFSSSRGGRR